MSLALRFLALFNKFSFFLSNNFFQTTFEVMNQSINTYRAYYYYALQA